MCRLSPAGGARQVAIDHRSAVRRSAGGRSRRRLDHQRIRGHGYPDGPGRYSHRSADRVRRAGQVVLRRRRPEPERRPRDGERHVGHPCRGPGRRAQDHDRWWLATGAANRRPSGRHRLDQLRQLGRQDRGPRHRLRHPGRNRRQGGLDRRRRGRSYGRCRTGDRGLLHHGDRCRRSHQREDGGGVRHVGRAARGVPARADRIG